MRYLAKEHCATLWVVDADSTIPERNLNKNTLKGAFVDVVGRIQQTIGRLIGSPKQEVKGAVKRAAGKTRKAVGNAQDAVAKSRAASTKSKSAAKRANRKKSARRGQS